MHTYEYRFKYLVLYIELVLNNNPFLNKWLSLCISVPYVLEIQVRTCREAGVWNFYGSDSFICMRNRNFLWDFYTWVGITWLIGRYFVNNNYSLFLG